MSHFFLFIFILFILAALLRLDFFFTLVYFFVGVYVLSLFWSRRVLSRLQASRSLPERAFWGDRITVTLKLHNRSHLPIPWLLLHEVFPIVLSSPSFFRQVTTLPGRASHTITYVLTARQRGYYQIGPLNLHSGDLLGLRGEMSRHLDPNHLIVYPKIVPIARLPLPTHSPQVILPTSIPLFEDPARPTGVRNYVVGDNPRFIHWPATAATGQLLVKQFQPAIARDNAIFLNLCRPDYAQAGYPDPAMELAITTAASLANHMAIHEGLPVGLSTTAFDPLAGHVQSFSLPPRKGRGHLMQILEVLARVQITEAETHFLEGVRQEAVNLAWGTTIMVITGCLSEGLAQTLLLLKRSGFQVTLVLVDPVRAMRQTREEPMQDLNLPVFKIRREQDIEVWSPVL